MTRQENRYNRLFLEGVVSNPMDKFDDLLDVARELFKFFDIFSYY